MYNTLITATELNTLISGSSVLILDCRFSLAGQGSADYGQRVYNEDHLPGAVFMHLEDDLSSPILPTTGRHPLPDVDKLSAKLQQSGLKKDQQVVVYDDCGGAMAARTWWLLRYLGHDAVALLDGGYPQWTAQGYAVSRDVVEPEEGDFIPQLRASMNVPVDDVVRETSKAHFTLIDARGAERYRGEQEPIDPVAGHIPGALNRPLTDNLQDGCFKSADQLSEEWRALLDGRTADTVVHYCGSGVTACHNLLSMEVAGLSGARIYAGSWSEWIRDPARPVATGE
ncbi:MAG: sulfurtransferase [Oceanospirillaceae bacterium]|nr:sulfurtransferase [Oceanospirillaceae bacterium]